MDRHGWDERYSIDGQTFTPQPNRLVVAEVAGLTPGTALDLAAGEGRHARWLASLGWRVVAVDFSAAGAAKARVADTAAGADVAWVVADVHRLLLPQGRFDLVLAAFFHPSPDEREALYRQVARALVAGGTFVQVSYDITNLTQGTGGPQDPDILIRTGEVAWLLERLGFSVTRAETVPLKVPTSDGGEVDVVNAVVVASAEGPSG